MYNKYIYELKTSLITPTEKEYLAVIQDILPKKYCLLPQINLASIINKIDNSKYRSELFRNIDAGIFDAKTYKPLVLIEINDSTHNMPDRRERDEKVRKICEEAGIPLVTFWVKHGINKDYMQIQILQAIEQSKNPIRISHSQKNTQQNIQQYHYPISQQNTQKYHYPIPQQNTQQYHYPIPQQNTQQYNQQIPQQPNNKKQSSVGCYIATCVYGSYDCPEVWTLRRFRDNKLSSNLCGRLFIRTYYAISPKLVKWFGNKKWFKKIWKFYLDRLVVKLSNKGFENTPYKDYNK